MSKYYLVNGTPKNAQVLCLPKEDEVVCEFKDISDIDLITTKIKREDISGTLKIYNEKILRGNLLVMEYPIKKTKGIIYRPFFNETNDDSKEIITDFDFFSKERSERVEAKSKNKSVTLELSHDDEFESFIYPMVEDIINSLNLKDYGARDLMSFKSLITYDLIKHIDKMRDDYPTMDDETKLGTIRHTCRSLQNYKSLRNFCMEYISWKTSGFGGLKRNIDTYAEEFKNGRVYLNQEMVDRIVESKEKVLSRK